MEVQVITVPHVTVKFGANSPKETLGAVIGYEQADAFSWTLERERTNRGKFAVQINIDRKTLYRWEHEIFIRGSKTLQKEYLGDGLSQQGLDRFQRFSILYVMFKKNDVRLEKGKRTNLFIRGQLGMAVAKGTISRAKLEKFLEMKNDN